LKQSKKYLRHTYETDLFNKFELILSNHIARNIFEIIQNFHLKEEKKIPLNCK